MQIFLTLLFPEFLEKRGNPVSQKLHEIADVTDVVDKLTHPLSFNNTEESDRFSNKVPTRLAVFCAMPVSFFTTSEAESKFALVSIAIIVLFIGLVNNGFSYRLNYKFGQR